MSSTDIERVGSLCQSVIPIPYESFEWSHPLYRLLDSKRKYLKIIPLLFSKKPIFINSNILVKNNSAILNEYLKKISWKNYDIIHVNRFYLADSVKYLLKAMTREGVYTVLDLDDIESVAVDRAVRSTLIGVRTPAGHLIRKIDLLKLKAYEKRLIPLFKSCIVCSEVDMRKVLQKGLSSNPWVVPNSVDTEFFRTNGERSADNHDIVFVGNMSFAPNVDAVKFFVRVIFPKIVADIPSGRFLIVGKRPIESVLNLSDGKTITVTGEVPDVRKYYRECALVVTPIRFGGGTRVKILEAMAMGKAIVSTSVGAEGISVEDNRDIILADNENIFAEKCVMLLRNKAKRREIGYHARSLVTQFYDRQAVEEKIKMYYSAI
jgi:glycosyltransferase involved in cell wall biosynthesis